MRKLILFFTLLITFSSFSQDQVLETSIKTLKGGTTSLKEIVQQNDLIIVSLWATWCVPCINELDAISDVYSDWQDEIDLEIIAISTDDSRTQKRIKPLINGKGWDYLILLDKNQELKRALNISLIPHVIVLKGNKILYRNTGYSPGAEDELFEIIKKYSK